MPQTSDRASQWTGASWRIHVHTAWGSWAYQPPSRRFRSSQGGLSTDNFDLLDRPREDNLYMFTGIERVFLP